MLDDVPKQNGSPIFAIWRTLARLDLREFNMTLSSAPASSPDEVDPLLRLASPEADALGEESWAELVARSLTSGPVPVDLSGNDAYDFIERLGYRVARQRRMGWMDQARRSTGRMFAFARLLVTRYPDPAAAHLAMSESHKNMAKNACRTDDHVAIERNWNGRSMQPVGPRSSILWPPAPPAKRPTFRNGSTGTWRRRQQPVVRMARLRRLRSQGDDCAAMIPIVDAPPPSPVKQGRGIPGRFRPIWGGCRAIP